MTFKALFFLFISLNSYAQDLCIQTFNTYGPAYAPAKNKRFHALSKKLLDENCGIIQLQEVWQKKHYQIIEKEFASSQYQISHADDGTRKDKAITGLTSLTRHESSVGYSELFQINNQKNPLDFIRDLTGVQKGFYVNDFFLREQSQKVRIINVHTHPQNEFVRLAQILQLIDFEINRGSHSLPTVVLGDFNAEPESNEIQLIKKTLLLEDATLAIKKNYKDICTYCSDNPLNWSSKDRVIDYIFSGTGVEAKLEPHSATINLYSYKNINLSDHYGVRVEFALSKANRIYNNQSSVVDGRIKKALEILLLVKGLLEKENSKLYESAIKTADKLIAQFNDKEFPDGFLNRLRQEN